MEHLIHMGILYDFYGKLLTDKQRGIAESYYFHNLSLAEIAETEGISRQAVHDLLHRTEELLQKYEERLRMYEGYERRRRIRESLQQDIKQLKGLMSGEAEEAIEKVVAIKKTVNDWVRIEEEQEDF